MSFAGGGNEKDRIKNRNDRHENGNGGRTWKYPTTLAALIVVEISTFIIVYYQSYYHPIYCHLFFCYTCSNLHCWLFLAVFLFHFLSYFYFKLYSVNIIYSISSNLN
jgi:hypothetical protein